MQDQRHAIAINKPQALPAHSSVSDQSKLSWWVEISTSVPRRTYYFGPFDSQQEARLSRAGYVKKLYQQETGDIVALVKHCQPDILTSCQEIRA